MKVYVLSLVTVATDVYNVENEVYVRTSEEAARNKLREVITEAQLDINVDDTTTYIDHYIAGVGSFYASITEEQLEEEVR